MALKRWSVGYERLLKEKGFLSPSELSSIVANGVDKERKQVRVKGQLVLAGFEELTPALSSLVRRS